MKSSRVSFSRRHRGVTIYTGMASAPLPAASLEGGSAVPAPSTSSAPRRSARISAADVPASRQSSTPRRSARIASATAVARRQASTDGHQDEASSRHSSVRVRTRRRSVATAISVVALTPTPFGTPSSAPHARTGLQARGSDLGVPGAGKGKSARVSCVPNSVSNWEHGRTPDTPGTWTRLMTRGSSTHALMAPTSTAAVWPMNFVDLTSSSEGLGVPVHLAAHPEGTAAHSSSTGKRGPDDAVNDGRPAWTRLALGEMSAASPREPAPPSGYRRKRGSSPPQRYASP